MQRLFISYRSLNSDKVDAIVARLRTLTAPDGSKRFEVWQDKDGIRPGQDWWEAIVDAIIACDVFVFMMSSESVKNINCRAELSYARKRNRPVLPYVLRDEYAYNPVTGKEDIAYWDDIPTEMDDLRAQFLFDKGTTAIQDVVAACDGFSRESQRWQDYPAQRPTDPRSSTEATNNSMALYDQACDYAYRLQIDSAERLFQKLVNRADPYFKDEAHEWILILRTYQELLKFDELKSTRHKVAAIWRSYQQQFPKPFIQGVFDPKGFATRSDGTTVGTPRMSRDVGIAL